MKSTSSKFQQGSTKGQKSIDPTHKKDFLGVGSYLPREEVFHTFALSGLNLKREEIKVDDEKWWLERVGELDSFGLQQLLLWSIGLGLPQVMEYCLDHGAVMDESLTDFQGRENLNEEVSEWMETQTSRVVSTSPMKEVDMLPLMAAVRLRRWTMVRTLLDRGVDCKKCETDENWSVVMMAILSKSLTGPNVGARDEKMEAADELIQKESGQPIVLDIIRAMIERGVDLEKIGSKGTTHLGLAVSRMDEAVVDLLLELVPDLVCQKNTENQGLAIERALKIWKEKRWDMIAQAQTLNILNKVMLKTMEFDESLCVDFFREAQNWAELHETLSLAERFRLNHSINAATSKNKTSVRI